LCVSSEIDELGGRRGHVAQPLPRWQHLVASHEATNVLHQAMHPKSYRLIHMAIEIASDLSAFFVVVYSLLPTTIAK
jgi:hypothetical protein